MTQAEYIKHLEQQLNKKMSAEKELLEKCQNLETETLVLGKKLANLEKDYKRLVLAKAVGLTEQQKKDNHHILDGWKRKIDNCLKLLN